MLSRKAAVLAVSALFLVSCANKDTDPTVPSVLPPSGNKVESVPSVLKPEDIRDLAAKSTASIKFTVPGIATSYGTGFFVAPGLIVTNAHVVDGDLKDCKITVSPPKALQQLYGPSRVIVLDKEHDLALMEVHNATLAGIDDKLAQVPVLKLADPSYEVKEGQAVYLFGTPEGYEGTFSDGLISAFRSAESLRRKKTDLVPPGITGDIIQFNAAISHGSSGSALLNNRGEVIGVCFAKAGGDAQSLNFAVSVKYLRDLLAKEGKTL